MAELKYLAVLIVIFAFRSHLIDSQVVNNIILLNHQHYMVDVIQQTVTALENRSWCNLKLPDTSQEINETIFEWEALGTVTYTNGFLVSIQHLDIMQSTVQQIWNRTHPGLVDVQGRLRLHNVAVGFDVLVNLTTANFRYTGIYTHPLVNYAFSVVIDVNHGTATASVVGSTTISNNLVQFLPRDNVTDVLNSLYVRTSTAAGVNAWGPEVFTPIVQDLVTNKIPFPSICYNCRL